MIIVATHNAHRHICAGWSVLKGGGDSLSAVETVIRAVEADVEEHSVGVGGYPNLIGELELDASIMEGRTRRSGAVAALQGFAHPISVARKVMDELPHVLLAGEGAAAFAREMGFVTEETVTVNARVEWENRLRDRVPADDLPSLLLRRRMVSYALLAKDPERIHGTVNVIAIDDHGDIASGVSTSGWAWKYPGRVGDSPIVGAGNYCDNRWGAVACTGHGERVIRAGTARSVLLRVELGVPLQEACRQALMDLPDVADPEHSIVVILAIDRNGNPVCMTNSPNGWGGVCVDEDTPQPRVISPVQGLPG